MIAILWRAVCCCIALSALFLLLALAAAIFNQKEITKMMVMCFAVSVGVGFVAADIFVIVTCGKVGLGL